MNNDYILWLGCVFPERLIVAHSSISPAANRWQNGLLNAVRQLGIRVEIIAHIPEAIYPRGRARIHHPGFSLDFPANATHIDHVNVPGVRNWSLSRGYLRAFRERCRYHGKPSCVMTYNAYEWNAAVGRHAAQTLGVPWYCVVADIPETDRELDRHERLIAMATGRIYLSWHSYQVSSLVPKMHLDGGVTTVREAASGALLRNGKQIILYAGAMNRWGGVGLLLDAFSLLKRADVELWLCGKGAGDAVMSSAERDARIRHLGCVEEKKLEELSRQAAVMVNPRPSSLRENSANFPSKVLEYLSYGKPVISTMTPGLSPEYRDVIIPLEDENAGSLANLLDDVLDWPASVRVTHSRRAFDFLLRHKTWKMQAERLAEFIR